MHRGGLCTMGPGAPVSRAPVHAFVILPGAPSSRAWPIVINFQINFESKVYLRVS